METTCLRCERRPCEYIVGYCKVCLPKISNIDRFGDFEYFGITKDDIKKLIEMDRDWYGY